MNSRFAILELGSTNTKGYIYQNNNLTELDFCTINFKKNYSINNEITEDDKHKLAEYIQFVKTHVSDIYAYGTSIFRQMPNNQLEEFKTWLKDNFNVNFNVVTSEQENIYTVQGAIKNYNLNDSVAVMIGGGGSTEISICKNGKIIEQCNSPVGVLNIQEKFPSLGNDTTNITVDEVVEYINSVLSFPKNKADKLILAGGNFLLRYNLVEYPVNKNSIFKDKDCPYIIGIEENINHDKKYFKEISLNSMREKTPNTPKWWDCTRAMCACTDAVALKLNSQILIPTSITMVYGIVEEILKNYK